MFHPRFRRPKTDEILSLETLAASDLTLALFNGTVVHGMFASAPADSAMGRLYSKMERSGEMDTLIYDSPLEALELMRSRGSEVAAFASVMTFSSGRGEEEVAPVWRFADSFHMDCAVTLPLDSELRGFLDHHLLRAREAGLRDGLLARWGLSESGGGGGGGDWARPEEEEASPLEGIGYANLAFPVAVLLGGIAAAAVLAFAERMCKDVVRNEA